jgi:arginyl-tRNA synthetase
VRRNYTKILEVAKKQSNENPVFYVQYAHAGIFSIIRMAEEQGLVLPGYENIKPSLPIEPER